LSTIAVLDLFYYGFQSANLWIFKRYITLVTKRAHDSKGEKNYPPPPFPRTNKQTNKQKRTKEKNLRTFSQFKSQCQRRQQEENLGNGVEVKNYIV